MSSGYDAVQRCGAVRDYEQFRPYIDKIKAGKHNVLWKGRPIYLAKTSGTTSGVKYIPIRKDSISNHIQFGPKCPAELYRRNGQFWIYRREDDLSLRFSRTGANWRYSDRQA